MPREEDFYTNPRTEMAPEDYAPSWDPYEDADYGDLDDDPNPYDGDYDDGGDDD